MHISNSFHRYEKHTRQNADWAKVDDKPVKNEDSDDEDDTIFLRQTNQLTMEGSRLQENTLQASTSQLLTAEGRHKVNFRAQTLINAHY